MARIEEITLRRLQIPLRVPYKLSLQTFHHFQPIVAEMRDAAGRVGWGEAEIHRGYGAETPEGGWAYCRAWAPRLIGCSPEEACRLLRPTARCDPHAASVLMSAAETIAGHPALTLDTPLAVPLLAPVHGMGPDTVAEEVDALIAQHFTTLKVKLGFDVGADLRRVAAIQQAVGGRARLRLDANQGFSAAEGRAFAAGLDPIGIDLLEQPCDRADWAANAAVAAVSPVPLMLDESIYGIADIDRAATVPGVGFVKLKLKKLGGLDALIAALHRIRELGLQPVLGDGTATEISGWLESCAARGIVGNAGEMNGFLKLTTPLFDPPLPFAEGAIRLPAGYTPGVDRQAMQRLTVAQERFAITRIAAPVRRAAGPRM